MMKVLIPYFLGWMLIGAGGAEIGLLAIVYAVLRDWRFWGMGLLGFIIGFRIP